ncbi:M24 family metallopeptidase [Azospirillum endophyticum]
MTDSSMITAPPTKSATLRAAPVVPFSTDLLDGLMEDAGLDVLLVTSKHNIQYMLGGHRSVFFHFMDALGTSRYLPILVYPKGRPDLAAFIGHQLERHQAQVSPFWTPVSQTKVSGTLDAVAAATEHVRSAGFPARRIGIETSFLPLDAAMAVRATFPQAELVDAFFPLERLRAVKTPAEIELLRLAGQKVIDAMGATIDQIAPGMTKADVIDVLRREEVNLGLTYEYCFLAAGTSLNRAGSDQIIRTGDILSIDSGGNLHGYIGDLARMAIVGEPDQELIDLLGEIENVQQAAIRATRAGATGNDIYAAAEGLLAKSSIATETHFLAHGMGLVSHEAPRLTGHGPIPYEGYDADRPLKPGMVISVETTLAHSRRGFIKLEDSLCVTDAGCEFLGEGARGWNRAGRAR